MSDTPTPTLRNWIASAYKNNGELPTAKALSIWCKVSEDEARRALDEYRPKVVSVENKPQVVEKGRLNVRQALDFLLDGGALIVALVVDIVMNVVGFSILAFDNWSRVGFIASAFVVVLFALRAWIKGGWYGKTLWAIFALIASFLDISLAVASSYQQSQIVVYDASKDDVLIALKEKEKHDETYLESLRAKQVEKGEGYKSQIDSAVAQANKSSEDVRSYQPSTEVYLGSGRVLRSESIFNAILDSIESGKSERIIGLVFFSLFFIALQLTIVTSATKVVSKIRAE